MKNFYLKDNSIPLFFCVPEGVFDDPSVMAVKDDRDGDDCHYNIFGINNDKAQKIFRASNIQNIRKCNQGEISAPVSMSEIVEMFMRDLIGNLRK